MKKLIAVALLAVPFTFAAQVPAAGSNAPADGKTEKVAKKHSKKHVKKAVKAETPAATPAAK